MHIKDQTKQIQAVRQYKQRVYMCMRCRQNIRDIQMSHFTAGIGYIHEECNSASL